MMSKRRSNAELTSKVLAGLASIAAGTFIMAPFASTAEAATADYTYVDIGSGTQTANIDASTGNSTVVARAAGDATISGEVKAVNAAGTNTAGDAVYMMVSNQDIDWSRASDNGSGFTNIIESINNSTASAEFSNTAFNAGNGTITFVTGDIATTASALDAGASGNIYIGLSDTDVKALGTNAKNLSASVTLDGNSNFSTITSASTSNSNGYIHLTSRGTLKADSAQIFDSSVDTTTTAGANQNPSAVRSDANAAVDFEAGTLELTDDYYNIDYLMTATELIHEADNGTTAVRFKNGATEVEVSAISVDNSLNTNEVTLGVYHA